jgi:ribosomal protein S12 methylthiotransferase
LGGSKNLVDSEHLLLQLQAAGYDVAHNADRIDGETVVVNTCGFIADAQQESIDTILRLGEAKRQGKIRNLFVMGCLSERFRADLVEALPEVDRFYGKFDWKGILSDLGHSWDDNLRAYHFQTTPSHYAYVKIGEGCNRHCAYCAIPLITGIYKSRPMDEIVDEVKQ